MKITLGTLRRIIREEAKNIPGRSGPHPKTLIEQFVSGFVMQDYRKKILDAIEKASSEEMRSEVEKSIEALSIILTKNPELTEDLRQIIEIEKTSNEYDVSKRIDDLHKSFMWFVPERELRHRVASSEDIREFYKGILNKFNQMKVDIERIFSRSSGLRIQDVDIGTSTIERGLKNIEAIKKLPVSVQKFFDQFLSKQHIPSDKFDFDELEGGALGKVAFGEERTDNVPFEKDTREEKRLYKALIDHIVRNEGFNSEQINLVKDLLNTGKYKKFIKRPNVSVLYRGITVSKKWFEKFSISSPGEDPPDSGEMIEAHQLGDISKYFKDVSSWTEDRSEAEWFAEIHVKPGWEQVYVIIMEAKVSDNPGKFFDLSGIYDLHRLKGERYAKEKEVVGFDPIKVDKITWRKSSKSLKEIKGYKPWK